MMAAIFVGSKMGLLKPLGGALKHVLRHQYRQAKLRRHFSNGVRSGPDFGLFFDIDGVIVRGREILPKAKEAFRLLTDAHGKFLVPTIFVTNAGNTLRANKARQLTEWLDIEVHEDQVIMSHSPLKMFRQLFDKHVLVTGQGPVMDIAANLGFTRVTTMEKMRHCFPYLDTVDHKRRKSAPCAFEKYFPKIDAVILFGEPVRWETNLQLIVDVLMTDGRPHSVPAEVPYPHIPVLGCNMDLLWMAEAPMPRFGHGSFLNCLESVYQKITGYQMKYTALVGKPSEMTYEHAENVLQASAAQMGLPGITRMYCIGDNPDVDIYGANLYNRRIHQRQERHKDQEVAAADTQRRAKLTTTGAGDVALAAAADDGDDAGASDHVVVEGMVSGASGGGDGGAGLETDGGVVPTAAATHSVLPEDGGLMENGAEGVVRVEECTSVLVCTGVYNKKRNYGGSRSKRVVDHNHRDFILDPELKKPQMMTLNVYDAVTAIFEKEGLS